MIRQAEDHPVLGPAEPSPDKNTPAHAQPSSWPAMPMSSTVNFQHNQCLCQAHATRADAQTMQSTKRAQSDT